MGMTVHCALCHDHKYDPLTQKDFYSLFAFFNNIDAEPETGGRGEEMACSRPRPGWERRIKERSGRGDGPVGQAQPGDRKSQEGGVRRKGSEKEGALTKAKQDLVAEQGVLERRRAELEKSMPVAMVMKERGEVCPTHIMRRGNYEDPAKKWCGTRPGFCHRSRKREKRRHASTSRNGSSHRKPADRAGSREPLWQQFFGVGLVKTSEDLGAQGRGAEATRNSSTTSRFPSSNPAGTSRRW